MHKLDEYYRGYFCIMLNNCLDILDNPFHFYDFIILFFLYACVPVHVYKLVFIISPGETFNPIA